MTLPVDRRVVRAVHDFPGAHEHGESEIENLHAAVGGDEQVARLEIAVDDALGVGRCKAGRDLTRVVDRPSEWERAVAQLVAKRLALEQLRHDERLVVMGTEIVDDQNVRMVQGRRGTGFVLELSKMLGVRGGGQDFDRHVALQARIAGAIDLAHASSSQERDDFVRSETVAGGKRHCGIVIPYVPALPATRVSQSSFFGGHRLGDQPRKVFDHRRVHRLRRLLRLQLFQHLLGAIVVPEGSSSPDNRNTSGVVSSAAALARNFL